MSGERPIIIKRKKVIQAAGHHGGAWKVAYADFVTAMMAFFLLMWLLGATTEDQRKGIADYFNTTIPIAATSGGGADALNGDSIMTEEEMVRSGTYQSQHNRRRQQIEKAMLVEEIKALAENAGLDDADARIRVRETEDGTAIDLVDAAGKPLFATGSSNPSGDLRIMIDSVAQAVGISDRPVKITGHTDALAYSSSEYSNWELSADRANAARRMLIKAGVPDSRFGEVSGRADREPLGDDPNDPANRRITIILQNSY